MHNPTAQQQAVRDAFLFGDHVAIQARAGTGKTTALELIAHAAQPRRTRYMAYNRAIVADAAQRFPDNVRCFTAHSMAFRAVGRPFAHRLDSGRVRSEDLAAAMGLGPLTLETRTGRRTLDPATLASLVMVTVRQFCQSADPRPVPAHTPWLPGIELPPEIARDLPPDERRYRNQDTVRAHIFPAVRQAWADLSDPEGVLPYEHGHYLKLWQIEAPPIPAEVLLIDEAQDLSPVILAVAVAQRHAQLVVVGDSAQKIYTFTGAVDMLAGIPEDRKVSLTESFRFGPEIATVANRVLAMLGQSPPVIGHPDITSEVRAVDHPDALLCRTNATAIRAALEHTAAGARVHLVGGAADLVSFAKAAANLKAGRPTRHRDLACFGSWAEVLDYVSHDPQGADMALPTDLVEHFGCAALETLGAADIAETDADLIVSTAHKSKGREWDVVQLAGDFYDDERGIGSDEELRLLYVAATRARRVLDCTRVPILGPDTTPRRATRQRQSAPPTGLALPAGSV